MAQRMPRYGVAFPAAIDRLLWLQPRIGAEIVEQAIGVETMKIGTVHSDRDREIGRFQAHRAQGQRPRLAAQISRATRREGARRLRQDSEGADAEHQLPADRKSTRLHSST